MYMSAGGDYAHINIHVNLSTHQILSILPTSKPIIRRRIVYESA